MSPVLLLAVSVVIFFVRATSGELNLESLAIVIEMGIDKFRTIVRVNAQQFKRQGLPDSFHSLTHCFLSFAQDRPGRHPGGVDVGEVQRMTAVSRSAVAGMRNQIDFGEAGLVNVPAIGKMVFQQGSRFGPTVDSFRELPLSDAEPIVEGAGTEAQELLFEPRRQVK